MVEREEFQVWMELLRRDIQGVHDRLDTLNGRTREVEQDVAVLKDRGTRDSAARATGLSGVAASALALLWQWLKG